MAQLPPDVPALDSPPAPEQGAPSTEFQRVLLPWADLNAQSPPAQWMELGKDLLPTIAVLAAMGPDQPHLLSTDSLARLITSTNLSNADILAAPAANASSSVVPTTPKLFPPGVSFYLGPADGNGLSSLTGPYLVLRNDAGVVTCFPPVVGNYEANDVMLEVPTIASAAAPAPPASSSGGGILNGKVFGTAFPRAVRAIGVYTTPVLQSLNGKGMTVATTLYGPIGGGGTLQIRLHRVMSDWTGPVGDITHGDAIIASNNNQQVSAIQAYIASINVYPGIPSTAGGITVLTLNDVIGGYFYIEVAVSIDVVEFMTEYIELP